MARQRAPGPQADWPTKHPWDKLPRGGAFPFVPPKGIRWPTYPKIGDRGGYKDADGNEWVPHYTPDPTDFHWDVQLPGGGHRNVKPDGEIHH